jgi:hypothetical protein
MDGWQKAAFYRLDVTVLHVANLDTSLSLTNLGQFGLPARVNNFSSTLCNIQTIQNPLLHLVHLS